MLVAPSRQVGEPQRSGGRRGRARWPRARARRGAVLPRFPAQRGWAAARAAGVPLRLHQGASRLP